MRLRRESPHETSEMQHFARELFLLARQCGAAGLAEEARTLFELARQASGTERSRGIDFLLYGAGARASRMARDGKPRLRLGPPQGMSARSRSIGCDERLQRRFEPCCYDEQHLIAGGSGV